MQSARGQELVAFLDPACAEQTEHMIVIGQTGGRVKQPRLHPFLLQQQGAVAAIRLQEGSRAAAKPMGPTPWTAPVPVCTFSGGNSAISVAWAMPPKARRSVVAAGSVGAVMPAHR